jgi:hypothetical protein
MTDTMTSQNTDLSSWDTLYIIIYGPSTQRSPSNDIHIYIYICTHTHTRCSLQCSFIGYWSITNQSTLPCKLSDMFRPQRDLTRNVWRFVYTFISYRSSVLYIKLIWKALKIMWQCLALCFYMHWWYHGLLQCYTLCVLCVSTFIFYLFFWAICDATRSTTQYGSCTQFSSSVTIRKL